MLSLASLCSAVFQNSTLPQKKFFERVPIQIRFTFEYKSVRNHVFKFLWKIWSFWGPGFYDMNFVHTYQIFTLLLVDVD
jgi:hypothetical protein